ncbi:MAG: hypothetical protein M1823_005170 [Watsoniomyces obsoletus]|nr:MAG: hypothetical protein M1823_005170 [Watsoniomyces obsoletus]
MRATILFTLVTLVTSALATPVAQKRVKEAPQDPFAAPIQMATNVGFEAVSGGEACGIFCALNQIKKGGKLGQIGAFFEKCMNDQCRRGGGGPGLGVSAMSGHRVYAAQGTGGVGAMAMALQQAVEDNKEVIDGILRTMGPVVASMAIIGFASLLFPPLGAALQAAAFAMRMGWAIPFLPVLALA